MEISFVDENDFVKEGKMVFLEREIISTLCGRLGKQTSVSVYNNIHKKISRFCLAKRNAVLRKYDAEIR